VGIPLFSRRTILAGAAMTAMGAAVASCGGDDAAEETTDTTAAPAETGGETTDVGTVTLGGSFTDDVPTRAMQAVIDATGLDVTFNNVDRYSRVQNFNTYLQQPDDVIGWYAGYRMRAFASKGVIGPITDVWAGVDGLSEGFKSASTGLDGEQYMIPFSFYPWGIFYRPSLFKEKGYEVPTKWADFKALCEKMKADGLIPIAASNDGKWQQMGWFDMINLRVNGYDFHISLMGGKESWEDDRVKKAFATWKEVVPYYQPNFEARTWQDAASALGKKEAGMYLLGGFVASSFDPTKDTEAQAILDELDFFSFPEIDPMHGQDAVEAPIDGWLMAKSPANEAGAKALLGKLATADVQSAYVAVNQGVLAANSKADTSGYTRLQLKSLEFVSSAKFIAQFLDRDTDPDFAATVMGPAIADFLAGADIDKVLKDVEAQKATYTFE